MSAPSDSMTMQVQCPLSPGSSSPRRIPSSEVCACELQGGPSDALPSLQRDSRAAELLQQIGASELADRRASHQQASSSQGERPTSAGALPSGARSSERPQLPRRGRARSASPARPARAGDTTLSAPVNPCDCLKKAPTDMWPTSPAVGATPRWHATLCRIQSVSGDVQLASCTVTSAEVCLVRKASSPHMTEVHNILVIYIWHI